LSNFESHQYIVINNKIGYKENDQVVYNIAFGYKTVFAYFKEFENGKITRESLEDNIGIYIKCCDFPYSKIPKMFDYIFGVSGTVESFGINHKKIIADEYDIKKYTIIPSIFGESKLLFNEQKNFFIEINENDNKNQENEDLQYFKRIKEEINKGLLGNISDKPKRAVLVFFKDLNCLNDFLSVNILSQIDFNIITENLNDKEIQAKIKESCRKGVVTLATASFGRGYDFIVKDKSINDEGGIHVIQTFLSDNLAEQTQIMGRTARYGNTGTYCLIVKFIELKNKYGISKKSLENQTCKYDFISNLREKTSDLFLNNFKSVIEQYNLNHLESLKLFKHIKNNNLDEVKKQIFRINKGIEIALFVARTKIYLDATSSMDLLIEKLKFVINQIFIRLLEILSKNNIPENSFSIQIVLFRNYDVSKEDILVPSGWEMKPDNLIQFLNKTKCFGGWEQEAIELCFSDAVKETKKLTNIIVFSDSDSNTRELTQKKRSNKKDTYTENKMKPFEYWNKTEFKDVIDVYEELSKIKKKDIPIYGFYVECNEKEEKFKKDAESFFRKISEGTGGIYEKINLHNENEAERLAKLISHPIIKAIGENIGDDQKRANLIKDFEKQYI